MTNTTGLKIAVKALALAALIGAAGTMFAPAAKASSLTPAQMESRFVALTNQARKAHHLSALVVKSDIRTVARNWTAGMQRSGYISHNQNLPYQVKGNWTTLGENVGMGGDVDSIQQAFMASKHHRDNILFAKYNQIGIGVTVSADGTVWVTVDFAQRS